MSESIVNRIDEIGLRGTKAIGSIGRPVNYGVKDPFEVGIPITRFFSANPFERSYSFYFQLDTEILAQQRILDGGPLSPLESQGDFSLNLLVSGSYSSLTAKSLCGVAHKLAESVPGS